MNEVAAVVSSDDIGDIIQGMGRTARSAAHLLTQLDSGEKNAILLAMADELEAREEAILSANAKDLANAREKGLSAAMVDRLTLTSPRLRAIAQSVREVVALPDPVGEELACWTRPNGLIIKKIRVPIGVIGIIFESRPNVTVDAAVLCFKSGNATILRGGSEAIHSNIALASALQEGGAKAGLPEGAVQLIPFTDRESVRHMAGMDRYIDVLIPRGGRGLIETVVSLARMPVIKHYDGICHIYLDKEADPAMAEAITVNAKCQKPGVCNAAETLLVHRTVAPALLPRLGQALRESGVELRADEEALAFLGEGALPATEADWRTEYLDLVISIRVVGSLDEAIEHIHEYGSGHSDVIVTDDASAAEEFLQRVDSAAVLWNASTRFNDGGEFGFGAEIGISTDKLHARGPMALPELTSYKYQITGTGQVRG
jgi:glutamate-5-semialdehyde dehydrogenase